MPFKTMPDSGIFIEGWTLIGVHDTLYDRKCEKEICSSMVEIWNIQHNHIKHKENIIYLLHLWHTTTNVEAGNTLDLPWLHITPVEGTTGLD